MPIPSAESTGVFSVSWDVPTASFVPGGRVPQSGFDEELRRLLRSANLRSSIGPRLHHSARRAELPHSDRRKEAVVQFSEAYWWAMLAAQLAEGLIGTLVLWRLSGMTLGSLRLWELIFFATHAATSGLNQFEALTAPIAAAAQGVPTLSVGFSGLRSLQGFVILILAYGALIPNTRRRSLAVVAALAAVPLAIVPAAAAVNPMLREGYVPLLIVQSALGLMFPAAIAVFAAARAAALQRRAIEAERRAEQIDQYALRRKLGEGGMGEVWLAEHRLLKRPWP